MFVKSPYKAPLRHPVFNSDEFMQSDIWVGKDEDFGKLLIKKDANNWIALNELYPTVIFNGATTSLQLKVSMTRAHNSDYPAFGNYVEMHQMPSRPHDTSAFLYYDGFRIASTGSMDRRWVYNIGGGIGFPVNIGYTPENFQSYPNIPLDGKQESILRQCPDWGWLTGQIAFGNNAFDDVLSGGNLVSTRTNIILKQNVWKCTNPNPTNRMIGRYVPDESVQGNEAEGEFNLGTAVWNNEELGFEITKKGDVWDGASVDEITGKLVIVVDGLAYYANEYDYGSSIVFTDDDETDIITFIWNGFRPDFFKVGVKMFEVQMF